MHNAFTGGLERCVCHAGAVLCVRQTWDFGIDCFCQVNFDSSREAIRMQGNDVNDIFAVEFDFLESWFSSFTWSNFSRSSYSKLHQRWRTQICPTFVWTQVKIFMYWCDYIIEIPTTSIPIHHNFTIFMVNAMVCLFLSLLPSLLLYYNLWCSHAPSIHPSVGTRRVISLPVEARNALHSICVSVAIPILAAGWD